MCNRKEFHINEQRELKQICSVGFHKDGIDKYEIMFNEHDIDVYHLWLGSLFGTKHTCGLIYRNEQKLVMVFLERELDNESNFILPTTESLPVRKCVYINFRSLSENEDFVLTYSPNCSPNPMIIKFSSSYYTNYDLFWVFLCIVIFVIFAIATNAHLFDKILNFTEEVTLDILHLNKLKN